MESLPIGTEKNRLPFLVKIRCNSSTAFLVPLISNKEFLHRFGLTTKEKKDLNEEKKVFDPEKVYKELENPTKL